MGSLEFDFQILGFQNQAFILSSPAKKGDVHMDIHDNKVNPLRLTSVNIPCISLRSLLHAPTLGDCDVGDGKLNSGKTWISVNKH